MSFQEADKIWFNGEFIDWEEANIHVLSHVVHYGSAVFEGDRCYDTEKGPAAFRLDEHVDRLFNSAKIYRMEIPYSREEFKEACLETIRVNELKDCYIRPVVFRGYESLGVNPFDCPLECVIAVWGWGEYLGEGAIEKGVDTMVSSWTRMAPNTHPAMAKTAGNYMNGQLIKMEAAEAGYIEAIALDKDGLLCEGSGENIFLVKDDVIYTPPVSASILPGITRDSVMTIAEDLGYELREEELPREMLYIADEVFFTGSAAEVTPIKKIDNIEIGRGERGPVTKELQDEFFAYSQGKKEDKFDWLTFVYE